MADVIIPDAIRIARGTVVDVVAGARWYNVQIGGSANLPCSAVFSSSTSHTVGTKQLSVYAPGTSVLVAFTVTASGVAIPPGFIIGCCTAPVGSADYRMIDNLGMINGADSKNDDAAEYIPTKQPAAMRDFNIGQPIDSVAGSDVGYMSEFGVGAGVSRFFSWMSASELSGLWCFYLDNLTRLAAYNYEFWHAGGERWIKNDEGEINDVDMFTPYPWEASGVLTAAIETFKSIKDGGKYRKGQYSYPYEPKELDQTLLPRWMRLRGYLGDMRREMVVLPAIKSSDYGKTDATFVEKMSRQTKYTGVLDVHQHSSGLYSIRSAQGLIFEKYIYIPVPKQIHAPEDSDKVADGATNYKPAGVWGPDSVDLTAKHNKQPWDWVDGTRPDTWAAELWDYSAYMFNWYGLKPVLAHKNDWWVVDEGFFANKALPTSGTSATGLGGAYIPSERLATSFNFPLPQFASIKIDHREGNTKYFYSRSVIAQLPDGSVLIEDGYGSSMHMTGGNIFLTGAGDVWLKPGRSIVMWAGDDLVARAGSSVDITAGNADVRIKAEHNLHMLAGNSGVTGGVVIETRSVFGFGGSFVFDNDDGPVLGEDVDSYGVIIKSVNAPVMLYGRDIYGKAIANVPGGGEDVGGNIEFEASYGLVMSAKDHVRYALNGLTDVIGQTVDEGSSMKTGTVVNRFDTANTVFSSPTLFRAKASTVILDSPGGIYAKGPFAVSGGIVPFPSSSVDDVIDAFSAYYDAWLTGGDATALPAMLTFYYEDMYDAGIKSDPDFIEQAGFTCRTEEQYGLTLDFLLPEARWQQVYRAANLGVLWYEPVVESPDGSVDTRPHPGNDYWLTYEKYLEYDPDLWQWKTDGKWALRNKERESGNNTDAASPYVVAEDKRAKGTSDALKPKFLSTSYLVSKQYAQE